MRHIIAAPRRATTVKWTVNSSPPAIPAPEPVQSVELIGPELRMPAACEAVLRTLPDWFGIEDSLLEYAADSARWPTFALLRNDEVIGFITLHEHFAPSWEIHCIAVRAAERGRGLGARLVRHAERWLTERGALFLQVKTVAATADDEHYTQTRGFYEAMGFVPLEVFPTLWSPRNPALQLVKLVSSTISPSPHC